MNKAVVWTIAGSDSCSGAGIQADLQTMQNLGTHACSVITAITAQNSQTVQDIYYLPASIVQAQMQTLMDDLSPEVIKIGMLGNQDIIKNVLSFLQNYSGKAVLDPVMISSSGKNLFCGELSDYLTTLIQLFPLLDLITPNILEAEKITGKTIRSYEQMECAAKKILSLGVKSVLLKGGHFNDPNYAQDYWTNGHESCWLINQRNSAENYHGTGCTLASAVAACLAQDYDIKDAIVLGKMYVSQAIRLAEQIGQGKKTLIHQGWPEQQIDLPRVTKKFIVKSPLKFPECNTTPLGLYPIVESTQWLEKLLPLGITTIQLRIKNKTGDALENEIINSIAIAKKYNSRLFINDYWQLAIKHQAYGVHLGQEDLESADLAAIHKAGLRLGISTHSYYEVAKAHAYQPSYLACGPIFPTTSKIMSFAPQGLVQLQRWRRTLYYPLVAIGGISVNNIQKVMATGVDGVAMISAITQAVNPVLATQQLLAKLFLQDDKMTRRFL